MLRSGEKFYNQAKWLLKERKKLLGGWLQAGSPITAEIFAKAGFDFVIVDLEHGPGDIMTLIHQMHAISRYEVVPFVRAPWNDFVAIKRILDAGVHGVLVPYVNNREEAEKAVRACKYPLEGIRGIAPSPRAGGFGMDGNRYLENANEQIAVMIAVETPEAVRNIDAIVATPGLDGIFIGPMDLSTSMGHFCDPKVPEVREAIKTVEKAVLGSDKFIGSVAGNFDQARELYERGYGFVIAASDTGSLAKLALDTVRQFHEAYPSH